MDEEVTEAFEAELELLAAMYANEDELDVQRGVDATVIAVTLRPQCKLPTRAQFQAHARSPHIASACQLIHPHIPAPKE